MTGCMSLEVTGFLAERSFVPLGTKNGPRGLPVTASRFGVLMLRGVPMNIGLGSWSFSSSLLGSWDWACAGTTAAARIRTMKRDGAEQNSLDHDKLLRCGVADRPRGPPNIAVGRFLSKRLINSYLSPISEHAAVAVGFDDQGPDAGMAKAVALDGGENPLP